MRAKLQALDLYRQSAIHSKHLQHTLLANVGSTDDKTPPAKIRELSVDTKTWQHREQAPNNEGHSVLERLEMKLDQLKKNMDEQKTVNEENYVSTALEQMDSLWWQVRTQFDTYLDAADGQVKSFKMALKALHAYTSECTLNFAGIKNAFATSARRERQTHAVLKEVWMTILPTIGVLTAKIEDNAFLLRFAQVDVSAVSIVEQFGLNTSIGQDKFCRNRTNQQSVAHEVVRKAINKGIYGQALSQLRVMLRNLVMLEDRFTFGGLGKAPNAEELDKAAGRLKVAKTSVDSAIPKLAAGVAQRAAGFCS